MQRQGAVWTVILNRPAVRNAVDRTTAVSDMRDRGDDGLVIHISSMAGHRGPWSSGVYSAAADGTYGQVPCLRADDVARAVRFVLSSPPHVQFHDLLVRPTQQPR